MKLSDFELYRSLLKDRSGLVITPEKSYLLDSRLGPVAKKWGYPSLSAMTMTLYGVPDPKLVRDIVEAMTTNETLFFRDMRPFETLKNVILPYYKEHRKYSRRMRIWCAACSSGQEPYSIAMTMKENPQLVNGASIEIYGSDISLDILEQAKKGRYSHFEVQRGLPVQMLVKYFEQQEDNGWMLKPEIRNMVKYEYFNLLESMTPLGQFDIIFCRNVLIYFDEKDKADILNRMHDIMPEDGFLFLGGAETVLGLTDAFKPIPSLRGLYIRSDGKYNMDILTSAAA